MSRTVVMASRQRSPVRRGRGSLLDWFASRDRAYPWRGTRDPYRVWVSEIMLQQTQAARVVPAFITFMERFGSVEALAAASRGEVLRAWGPLGYPRRAVALSEAARIVVRDHADRLPSDPDVLRQLPGIGAYTANAIASIAFGRPVAAIDTNVRRIVARVHLGVEANGVAPLVVAELANAWVDRIDPGRWNQALMDLGREVCRPRPRCERCPLATTCRFRAAGRPVAAGRGKQAPFEGSTRQVRGAIVRSLRACDAMTVGRLVSETGFAADRVVPSIGALAREGIVAAGSAAIAGSPRGRVRLAD
jgi:A/G-specific adenine glycosylase